jgi:hypothetical protein
MVIVLMVRRANLTTLYQRGIMFWILVLFIVADGILKEIGGINGPVFLCIELLLSCIIADNNQPQRYIGDSQNDSNFISICEEFCCRC